MSRVRPRKTILPASRCPIEQKRFSISSVLNRPSEDGNRATGGPPMGWIPGLSRNRRQVSQEGRPALVEVLEPRTLLADGISPAPGPAINAVAGVAINNAVFATYTVTDPSGAPGTQWRAKI